MRRLARILLLLALTCPALAQQRAPAPSQAPAPQEAPPPPYEPQMLRLAEILGALSYLRDLCGPKDSDTWRNDMRALMEAEAQTEARKERLAGAFNRGFRGYEVLYRSCTPNAVTIIDRFLSEGEKLSNDLSNRFGGG